MINIQDHLRDILQKMGVTPTESQIEKYILLVEELLAWNKKINLTAITRPQEAVEKHIADSLTLCPLLENSQVLLDIGSGAGFPCLPLKIASPHLDIYSVEASGKKTHFQRHAARKLGLQGFTVIHARAEELKDKRPDIPGFDTIVARAVTSLPGILKMAKPLLAGSGRVIAMKGRETAGPWEGCEISGWTLQSESICRLPVSDSLRRLLVYTPVGEVYQAN